MKTEGFLFLGNVLYFYYFWCLLTINHYLIPCKNLVITLGGSAGAVVRDILPPVGAPALRTKIISRRVPGRRRTSEERKTPGVYKRLHGPSRKLRVDITQ